jgi:hypothetical protein
MEMSPEEVEAILAKGEETEVEETIQIMGIIIKGGEEEDEVMEVHLWSAIHNIFWFCKVCPNAQ